MTFRFPVPDLPDTVPALRQEVRDFLAQQQELGTWTRTKKGWAEFNRTFSEALGAKGWIGMTWPKRYGGHERDPLERYAVAEELLVAGAPIRAHWAAERQIGPLILEFGTDWQKETLLPRFAAGEISVAVGLSEADSGSDLAAISTRAEPADGGWIVNGRKVWITNAHNSEYMTLFVRTTKEPENRRDGITRFLVDMTKPGITITPIKHMAGEADLNEVTFDNVFIPDKMVLGEVDKAWSQMSTELAAERSSPDRWTASFGLLQDLIDRVGPSPDRYQAQEIGRVVADLWTLKGMSISIAGMNQNGRSSATEGSIVKDLGTHLDQDIPDIVRRILNEDARAQLPPDDRFHEDLHFGILFAPAMTIRGGTREILRNGIARGLGIR